MMNFIKDNWMSILAIIISLVALFRDLVKDFFVYKKQKKTSKKANIRIKYLNKKIVVSNYGESCYKYQSFYR